MGAIDGLVNNNHMNVTQSFVDYVRNWWDVRDENLRTTVNTILAEEKRENNITQNTYSWPIGVSVEIEG